MSDSGSELRRLVRDIGLKIESAADGELYEVDGEAVVIDDLDSWTEDRRAEAREAFVEEHPEEGVDLEAEGCETYEEYVDDNVEEPEEPERMSLGDYVKDSSLGDVRAEVALNDPDEVSGGRILFCFGGPNVWVHDDCVRGYWGSDEETYWLSGNARDAVLEWLQEQWECARGW